MKPMISAPDKLNCARKVCATFIWCAAVVAALPAQTLTTLYNFGQFGHGVAPNSLLLTTGGNYYGTTAYGGTAWLPGGLRDGLQNDAHWLTNDTTPLLRPRHLP